MSAERKVFGIMPDGKKVECVHLKSGKGMELEAMTYGCRIRRLLTRDAYGNFSDVVLGFDTLKEYYETVNFQGAVVGRYGNRIGNAQFELDGETYTLTKNDGRNTLHGGPGGFYNVVWDIAKVDEGEEPSVTFTYLSKDGEEGYPGNLQVSVTYTLTSKEELKIEYEAVSDKKTPFNMTNHSYFNLSGDLSTDILDHELCLDAYGYTQGSEDLIPNGKILPLDGTPFDFRKAKGIGQNMDCQEPSIKSCGGYDHTYALNGEGLRKIGYLYCVKSGRAMSILTDLPSIQLYTDNDEGNAVYKNGIKSRAHQSVCLETQMFPDSPNRPEFPSTILLPGKPHKTVTIYQFFVR